MTVQNLLESALAANTEHFAITPRRHEARPLVDRIRARVERPELQASLVRQIGSARGLMRRADEDQRATDARLIADLQKRLQKERQLAS